MTPFKQCMHGALARQDSVELADAAEAVIEYQLASGKFKVPLLPPNAELVLRAATQPEPDLATIGKTLHRDGMIASHVLRLANSPVYRGVTAISGLDQAVLRLGANKLREIALIVGCKRVLLSTLGYEEELSAILRHGLATAIVAEAIARTLQQDQEQSFLQGLVHDIGEAVIIHAISRLPSGTPPRELVLGLARRHHVRASVSVVGQWQLPTRLGEVIAHHHDDEPPAEVAMAVRRLQLAESLLEEEPDAELMQRSVDYLALPASSISQLRKSAGVAMEQAIEFF
ncbi:MAG: HDOD domain-containing protein [Polyangiaceae bacterium]